MTIPMLSPSNKVSPSAFGLAVGGHRTGPLRRDNEGACAGPQHTPQGKLTERQAEIPIEGPIDMTLDEYLTQNRDLPFSEACDRYAERTGQSGHDINDQLAREREARNEHFRRIDGY